MIGTLTLSILIFVHTLTSSIFLHQSCSVATYKHSKLLLLENYVRIVALAPDLRKVHLYSATEFLYYNSTIELLLLLMLIKRSYLSFRALLPF